MSTHRQIFTSLLVLAVLIGCLGLTARASFAGQREYPEEISEWFGKAGTGNGQFEKPTGIAVNETTGDVYVVDKGNNRIEEFGPEGKYLSQFNGSETPAKSLSEPSAIAVDNSPDAEKGDVYVADDGDNVIDVFNSTGTYLRQIKELPEEKIKKGSYEGKELFQVLPAEPLKYLTGIAIDPTTGNVWVSRNTIGVTGNPSGIVEFSDTGSYIERVISSFHEGAIAVDSSDAIYVSRAPSPGKGQGGTGFVEKRNAAGAILAGYEYPEIPIAEEEIGGLAVDLSSHYVFFDAPGGIQEYAPFEGNSPFPQHSFGTPFQVFATKGLGESRGIAVDAATNVVYATEAQADRVAIIPPVAIVTAPTVDDLPPAASEVKRTTALISATLNPDNGVGDYHLEYVEAQAYEPEASEPYAAGGRTAETGFGRKLKGSEEDATDQTFGPIVLSGLKAGTTYDYRLVASNQAGTTVGPDHTFTTASPTPPVVSTGPASEATQTSVTLTGTVDPEGLQTSYEFEIGTNTAYEGAELFGNAGLSAGTETIAVSLAFLVPGTTYHYRILATNTDGTSYGQDETFTTAGVPQSIVQPLSEPLLATPAIAFPAKTSSASKPKKKIKAKKKPQKNTKKKAKTVSKAKK